MAQRSTARGSCPALSPVVAVLLLLAISVALTVMLYTTLVPMASSIVGYCAISQAVERVRVDSAVLFENSTFIVVVRNVGEVACELDDIYLVDSVTGSLVARSAVLLTDGQGYDRLRLEPGSVVEVAGSFGTTLTKGKVYEIKVVTANGVEDSYRVAVVDG